MPPRVAIHGAAGRLGRLIAGEAGTAYAGPVPREGPIPDCDVVIDVTSAAGTGALIQRLSGQPLVVGTTGELPLDALRVYSERAPVVIVPNFSFGIPMLISLLEAAVPALPDGWRIEVIEAHHHHKKDAPSGTAKRLVRAIGRDVPTHSMRLGDTVGTHEVWLAGPGERLELTHVATRREVFAIGALRWAEKVQSMPSGLHQP